MDSYALAGVQHLMHVHSGSARALQDAMERAESLHKVAATAAEKADGEELE